jgi:hypothetical protein
MTKPHRLIRWVIVVHLRFSAASPAWGMVSSDRRDGVFHSAPLRCLQPTLGSVEIPDSLAGFLESGRGVSLTCCQVPRRHVQPARWRKCQRRSNASLFILVQVQAGPPPRLWRSSQWWRGRNIAALMTPIATKATTHIGQIGARLFRLERGRTPKLRAIIHSALK